MKQKYIDFIESIGGEIWYCNEFPNGYYYAVFPTIREAIDKCWMIDREFALDEDDDAYYLDPISKSQILNMDGARRVSHEELSN